MAPRGRVQKAHQNYFYDLMFQIEWDLHQEMLDNRRVPDEWHQIARKRVPQKKTRITLRVENDVVTFFKKMGPGYQQRMNDVLAAWMHGRLSALIDGPDAQDADAQMLSMAARPRLGDTDLRQRGLVRTPEGRIVDMDTGEDWIQTETAEPE